jgi:hypothetical protein
LEDWIVKVFKNVIVVAAAIVSPVAAFAQSDQPLTRAQVRTELVQLEKAGYVPGRRDESTYPRDIQAAEARVQAAGNNESRSVGGVSTGSDAGHRAAGDQNIAQLFQHH